MQQRTSCRPRVWNRIERLLARPGRSEIGSIAGRKILRAPRDRAFVKVQRRPDGDAPPFRQGPGRIDQKHVRLEPIGWWCRDNARSNMEGEEQDTFKIWEYRATHGSAIGILL